MNLSVERCSKEERELDKYFCDLAIHEGQRHIFNGAGEKGCRLLAAVRELVAHYHELENKHESLTRDFDKLKRERTQKEEL